MSNFRPLHNQVVIRPEPVPESAGLIFVPESARQSKPDIGVVVSMGEGWRRGKRVILKGRMETLHPEPGYDAMDLNVGDRVVFDRFGGQEHRLDGEMVVITPVERVWAVLET